MSDKRVRNNQDKENEVPQIFNDFLIPPSKWVYTTPPMQKIQRPKLKGSSIQTAFMCRTNISKNEMYELNPNIKVDMTKVTNPNQIQYDPRYMRKITFDNNEIVQGSQTLLEPSRHTKFVSRYPMAKISEESAMKPKRNLFGMESE